MTIRWPVASTLFERQAHHHGLAERHFPGRALALDVAAYPRDGRAAVVLLDVGVVFPGWEVGGDVRDPFG